MATRIIGTSVGDKYTDVVTGAGSAVAADDVELTYDLATVTSREQVFTAIERIKQKLMEANFPPA